MASSAQNFVASISVIVGFSLGGCQTETVEYHSRPTWHTALSGGMPVEQVRENGTIMKYKSSNVMSKPMQEYLDSIVLEEKDELTGKLTLLAIFPEHVIDYTMNCLRDKKWDILFEQIISNENKEYYLKKEDGRAKFETFFTQNRRELARTLQRIRKGKDFGDVQLFEQGAISIHTLSPRIARDYEFSSVSFMREGQFLKLHSIR
jgi:hypothetical protein